MNVKEQGPLLGYVQIYECLGMGTGFNCGFVHAVSIYFVIVRLVDHHTFFGKISCRLASISHPRIPL